MFFKSNIHGCDKIIRKNTKHGRVRSSQGPIKKGREESQERGFIGIIAVLLIIVAAIIYFFGTDTLVDILSKLLGVI